MSFYKRVLLAKVLRLPIIHLLIKFALKYTSFNRFWIHRRIFWLKITLVLAILSGLILSFKLWVSARSYPQAPVISELSEIPYPVDYLIFISMIVSLVWSVFALKPRVPMVIFLVLSGIEIFFDQSRLQPWFYQYIFMMLALVFFSWNRKDGAGEERVLRSCGLIIASIYFYSGMQKINLEFTETVFPWMTGPLVSLMPKFLAPVIGVGAYFASFVEIYIGVGLLRRSSRKIAAVVQLGLVAFILFSLISLNWNSVVWPWNLAMAFFVLIIFWPDHVSTLPDYLINKGFKLQPVLIALFVILPMASFINMWDSYLSFTLYSANTNSAQISIKGNSADLLPTEIQRYSLPKTRAFLDITGWSMHELNVPAYPEERIFKAVFKNVCEYSKAGNEFTLIINGKPTHFNPSSRSSFSCNEI